MPELLNRVLGPLESFYRQFGERPTGPSTIGIHRFDGTTISTHQMLEHEPHLPYSIDQVEQTLNEALATPVSVDVLEGFVEDLGTAKQLQRLIFDILDNPERLAEVTAKSELHPLGFYKIPLLSTDTYQLRINIWPATRLITSGPIGEDIHSHRFDFASKVLSGRLDTWVYEFTEEAPLFYRSIPTAEAGDDPVEAARAIAWLDRQLARVSMGLTEEHEPKIVNMYGADQSRSKTTEAMVFQRQGYARLMPEHPIIGAGGIYSLTHSTYHRAWSLGPGDTATLFLRGSPIIESDTIARLVPAPAVDSNRPKERLTIQQTADQLTKLALALAA